MSFCDKVKQFNNDFKNGVLPDEFLFNNTKRTVLDDIIEDVKYLAFYKEYKINEKFPFADSIAGFKEAVIDKLIDDVKDLSLSEILENKKNSA